MKFHSEGNLKVLVAVMITITVMTGVAYYYVEQAQLKFQEAVTELASEELTGLISLANALDQGAVDDVTAALVSDCGNSQRQQFESLLDNLANLNQSQLQEVKGLFDRCGDYFANRRAIMAARLQQEVQQYRDYLQLLESVSGDSSELNAYGEEWVKLADGEAQQAESSSKLVSLQGAIIEALSEGKRSGSDEIVSLLYEVQQTQGFSSVLEIQIDQRRNDLIARVPF